MNYAYEDYQGNLKTLTQDELESKGGSNKFFGGSPLVVKWWEYKCQFCNKEVEFTPAIQKTPVTCSDCWDRISRD